MKTRLFTTVAMALMFSTLSVTGAYASKTDEITAPVTITDSASPMAAELSALWVDGKRQEFTGLAQIEDAEKAIKKAQKDERKAKEKLAKVQLTSDEQRAAYTRLVAGFGAAATPYAVETEIKALKKAADDWKKAYQKVETQTAALKEVQTDLANGQSALRTGNELVATGRKKMNRAETQSAPGYVAPAEVSTNEDGDA